MKKFIHLQYKFLLALVLMAGNLYYAQNLVPERQLIDLPNLNLSRGISLHFVSPEPIQFVDLSTSNLSGDLPADNIARVKITDPTKLDSLENANVTNFRNLGVITIVAQSFIAQYKINYVEEGQNTSVTNIQIQPEDMQPLEYPKMGFSDIELQKFALNILRKKIVGKPLRQEKDLKITIQINNIYVVSDYIFLDMNFVNSSNLGYGIENLKFSVEDKKIYKATNNQSIEIHPAYQLYEQKSFKKSYRNIYVFKKFTYPNSKVLKIRLYEEELSGRTLELTVNYSDILKADTF